MNKGQPGDLMKIDGVVCNPERKLFGRRQRVENSVVRWYRERDWCPEPGLGGGRWHLEYRGDLIGFVFSTWAYDIGVHYRCRCIDRYCTITKPGSTEPLAFAKRHDAANFLLDLFGVDQDEAGPLSYDHKLGPRGGGFEYTDPII